MNTLTKTMFAALAGCMLLFAGCQKEEQVVQVNTSTTNLPIFGYWKSVSYIRYLDEPISYPNPQTSSGTDTGSIEIELHVDSTFQLWSDDNTIAPDTGMFKNINGTLTMLPPNRWSAFNNAPLIYHTDSTMSLYCVHWAENTLNDTGANPVLGDSAYSVTRFLMIRQ
ncbi:MAG: hypothetical protein U1O81_07895 [Planktothrix rubescens PR223]|jgi:hypothetical protein